jgi:hypothetical protein
MSNREFALCIETCVVKLISSESQSSENEHDPHNDQQPLFRQPRSNDDAINFLLNKGMTVEIKDYLTKNNTASKYCTIKILDYYNKVYAFENNLYMCKNSSLFRVSSNVWPYLIAIVDPLERLEFARDKHFTDYIRSLSENDLVLVDSNLFKYSSITASLNFSNNNYGNAGLKHKDFECVIHFIGLVPERGNGYFFGLQLVVINFLFHFIIFNSF